MDAFLQIDSSNLFFKAIDKGYYYNAGTLT